MVFHLPFQKPTPDRELIAPEKATDRAISLIRIRIEHAIGGVKRYRMMKDKIRLLKRVRVRVLRRSLAGLADDVIKGKQNPP